MKELNPHQQKVARERHNTHLVFTYCPTCKKHTWANVRGKNLQCRECGTIVERKDV